VVTTFSDITAHRQALEVLRASEEKFRGLLDSLPIMLLQSDRSLNVTYINPATQQIAGYALEQLHTPALWQAIVRPDDRPNIQRCSEQALAGQTCSTEIHYRAADGTEKVAFAILQPHRQDGEVVGITILAVDMTLQRQLERELQRAQRLELVGRLASGIAHDFNNLLTVMVTLADLARESLPPGHEVGDDLQRISAAGQQASHLAGQLLTFSKQRRVAARCVDLNAVATQTLALLRGSLPGTIAVYAHLHPARVPVLADEMQMEQVLMNLCLNARDAMAAGGRLVVETGVGPRPPRPGNGTVPRPDADGSPVAEWVRLSVSDTGHGMEADLLGRIFDPFFSTKERGSGLGLAVVRQIVDSCAGVIEVQSKPGHGTRFDVWLPRLPETGLPLKEEG
jgi:PAS domain S-box-containing protein